MTMVDDYIWTGSTEGIIRLWDSKTCKNFFHSFKNNIFILFFHLGKISIVELAKELQGHTGAVSVIECESSSFDLNSSQRLVFSGSYDWTIRVWNSSGFYI